MTFTLEVEWLEITAPERARMKVHGDSPGSFVDGENELKVSPIDEATTNLEWTADVNVGGKIVSIAARLMNAVAQKINREVFLKVCKRKWKAERSAEKSEAGLASNILVFYQKPVAQAQLIFALIFALCR